MGMVTTASEALALIQDAISRGLTPVMAGTSFYRHSFQASQFGAYVTYLDERGTAGEFLPRNVRRCLDFVAPREAPLEGAVGLGVAVVPPVVVPSLLEAAEAALGALEAAGVGGVVVRDLSAAIASERSHRGH